MNMNQVFVEVSDVRFAYRSVPVLTGVSLTVERGEIAAVLGPNGTGKTTFLKCLNRLLRPSGAVMIEGQDVSKLDRRQIARSFGFIPQDGRGDFAYTVREAVLMGRYSRAPFLSRENAEDANAVLKAMEMTGIGYFADRPFAELSGGEKQKVVIARALAQEPLVLLCDEPTLHLDMKSQRDVLRSLRRYSRECGVSVFFVSHDINLALQFADKFFLLHKGGIHAAGGKETLTVDNLEAVFGIRPEIIQHEGNPVFHFPLG